MLYELLSLLELPFHHAGLGRGREAHEQLCTHSSAPPDTATLTAALNFRVSLWLLKDLVVV